MTCSWCLSVGRKSTTDRTDTASRRVGNAAALCNTRHRHKFMYASRTQLSEVVIYIYSMSLRIFQTQPNLYSGPLTCIPTYINQIIQHHLTHTTLNLEYLTPVQSSPSTAAASHSHIITIICIHLMQLNIGHTHPNPTSTSTSLKLRLQLRLPLSLSRRELMQRHLQRRLCRPGVELALRLIITTDIIGSMMIRSWRIGILTL